MHEPVPEAHETGAAAFVRRLRCTQVACEECGFEAGVVDGDWGTTLASEPLSSPVVYELTCPNCGGIETLEIHV